MEFSKQAREYASKKARLIEQLNNQPQKKFYIHKKTASNLFRYTYQSKNNKHAIALKEFDNILSIDTEKGILEVEGLTPYEKIVEFTLQYGYLPTVAPELKHITIAGAIVGIGIESSGYRYGFVHDGLMEAEVLLHDGRIVLCTPDNEYSDLFFALPNSYGTLGYILRAKILLYPAQSFVHLKSEKFSDISEFINAMQNATHNASIRFIEGLAFSALEFYMITAEFQDSNPHCDDIYKNRYYKLIKEKTDLYLTTTDYIFRYDPDWFWNIPEKGFYSFLRKIVPKKWRNSGFYKKYLDTRNRLLSFFTKQFSLRKNEEPLIQDWEVPWKKGIDLLQYALDQVDISGMPWAVVPIKPLRPATLYPLQPGVLYFNLGCYCSSKRSMNQDSYHNTKIMDEFCFSLGGIKMLYSSTFISLEKFNSIYNGKMYQTLKQKYDPKNLAKNLYEKVNKV